MFDFGQLPTWLRRATWDWKIVKRVRSKKSLSKVPGRVPVFCMADWQKESFGCEEFEASDRRFEFPYCNDSYSSVVWSFVLLVLSVLAFAYVVFSSYDMVYRDLFLRDVSGYSLFVHVAAFSVFVLCLVIAACALFLVFPSLFHLFCRAIGKRRRHTVIFDRERGVVILPPIAFGSYDEVPWESLVVVNFYMPKLYGGTFRIIKAFRPSDLRLITLNEDFPDEAMAFYCWYMDRSKPLPPDRVFDPYRERDEERRLREFGPEVVRQFPASLTDRRMGGAWGGGAFGVRAER